MASRQSMVGRMVAMVWGSGVEGVGGLCIS